MLVFCWYHILVFYISYIRFTIILASSNQKQYFDDVIQFWKCVHWIPLVSKPLPYMLKYKCGIYYVFIKLSFCLVQSESSILMTSYSFEIVSIVFYVCPNPLYVEIQMWHVLWLHEIGILASTNQKTVYWWRHRVLQMCSLKSTGAKTPYMFKYKCYMYYVFIFSLKLVSSKQKTVFWWRHTVLKICPSYSTGPQTPWLLATLTFSSVLNEYLFLAHFEFILAHCATGSWKIDSGYLKAVKRYGIWVGNRLQSDLRKSRHKSLKTDTSACDLFQKRTVCQSCTWLNREGYPQVRKKIKNSKCWEKGDWKVVWEK